MSLETEPLEEKAIRLLKRQLEELQQTVGGLNYKDPNFKAWYDTTLRYVEKFLGSESPHLDRLKRLRFSGPGQIVPFGGRVPPPGYVSPEDARYYKIACETAAASLKAAITEVEELGVYTEETRPAVARGKSKGRSGSGGVTQTYHGPVTIHSQAIATDEAIQKIGRMGDTIGTSLGEIAELFQQSMDLTRRQLQDGLAGVQGLAEEVQKPEPSRNWKAVLGYGQTVLEIASSH